MDNFSISKFIKKNLTVLVSIILMGMQYDFFSLKFWGILGLVFLIQLLFGWL